MPSYGYSSRLERVLESAREVAATRGATTLESEHLAIALLFERGTAASAVIDQLTPDRESLATGLSQPTTSVEEAVAAGDLPYSDQAKATLKHVMMEARQLRHTRVCTAHLLLALLAQETTTATRRLQAAGVDLTAARNATGNLTEDQLKEDG